MRGGKIEKTTISRCFALFLIKICTNHAFFPFFYHYYGGIFEIPLRIHPLFSPYIPHEQTAQNLILSVR